MDDGYWCKVTESEFRRCYQPCFVREGLFSYQRFGLSRGSACAAVYWLAVHRSRVTNRPSTYDLDKEILVALFIIDEAKRDARQFSKKQETLVKTIFEQNISPYSDAQGSTPRSRTDADSKAGGTRYLGIFRERDAYYAHKLAYPELVVDGLVLPSSSNYD